MGKSAAPAQRSKLVAQRKRPLGARNHENLMTALLQAFRINRNHAVSAAKVKPAIQQECNAHVWQAFLMCSVSSWIDFHLIAWPIAADNRWRDPVRLIGQDRVVDPLKVL